ncbi:MAG: hypothetical protein JHC93_01730 [Parachlamydiales bacterium]|nr:hypothetical protein [Parachlamydiales bacterium]
MAIKGIRDQSVFESPQNKRTLNDIERITKGLEAEKKFLADKLAVKKIAEQLLNQPEVTSTKSIQGKKTEVQAEPSSSYVTKLIEKLQKNTTSPAA